MPDKNRAASQPPSTPTPTFIHLYDTLVTTGLLARLSGSAFKVLAVLGMAASPLGSGSAASRAFARDLVAAGAVTPADRGRLFCCLPHHELARRAGLGKNTVTRCTCRLHALGLVEKRAVGKPDGTRYNIYFLQPASHVDKFNTHRAQIPTPHSPTATPRPPLPETGTVPVTGTVPPPGPNYIQDPTPPPPPRREGVDNNLDPLALLAHFAERQGLARYRPTVHDRRKLDLLQQRGYTQAQVLAAIDRAFDRRPADAPPIRMFSFCATIALAGPAAGPPPANTVESPRPNPPIPESTNLPTPILTLYTTEIGPLSPLACRELERLVAAHPQAAEWDYAFSEAVRANVRRLSYVEKVLQGRAARRAADQSPSGGKNEKNQSAAAGPGRREDAGGRRNDAGRRGPGPGRSQPGHRPNDRGHGPGHVGTGRRPFNWATCTQEELLAVQRACSVAPLDPAIVLGTGAGRP